ncbi:amino acid transporter [Punctularia strigosozonata HHB-11173 SS5]|uniref:amino acid transporter n=1 Tax=Punctularia strigosozonata (strain HHB-11173) TaxID=741275 RepID=UPI0004417222|nr:amino acid transporter [Punctularia strigosozonata HHB-11173 SS5]EIN11827.1 amino acid transporter [Punctularia strigosozonata HHB-11173 SS5]
MLGRSRQAAQSGPDEGEARQPLLDDGEHDNVIFNVGDDEDSDGARTPDRDLLHEEHSKRNGHVRFQEEVQVIAPPLRSTLTSREIEYEQDSDVLNDHDLEQLEATPGSHRQGRRGEQAMPLLVGLLDTATVRRSLDGSLSVNGTGNGPATEGLEGVDLDELAAKRTAGGGLLESVANMANSILGAGLPYALAQAGFFTGLFLLVVLCGVTDWTIRLIVLNAKLSGRNSYIGIMDACFGPSGRAAVSFFQFAFAFGGMCAFGIIIGDTIPAVIRFIFPTLSTIPVLSLLTNRQFVIALCTICVSYPLSLHRSIDKLARASGFALIGMLVIVFSILIEAPRTPPELHGDPARRFSLVGPGVFQAVGVMSFAFVCHHNSLLIYGALKTPTMDRFKTVTHISTGISLAACVTLSLSGYLVFTDKTQGNILNNFAKDDTLINVARFCFGMNMFTTLPLELFVCREVIEQYFFSHEVFSPQRHLFFTTAIVVSSMFLALITCDLGVMLEITGGVSATALAFIFPAACYIQLANPGERWTSRKKLPAVLCVAFGSIVLVMSLFIALGKAWTPAGSARICA